MRPKLIGVLGFDGVTAIDVTGPMEALSEARVSSTSGQIQTCYETVIVGVSNKKFFVSETGVVFKSQRLLRSAPIFDTIIIPGGRGLRQPETNKAVADWLVSQEPYTRRFVSICTGIYGLAASGLIDGRSVTTHWRFAPDVARRFPALHMNYVAAFLKDDRFYTSGGNIAGIEMVMSLIEEDFGQDVALSVARELTMQLRPPGENESDLDPSAYQSCPTGRMADLPGWIVSNLQEDLSVDMLAERSGLCPRHFTRIFKRLFRTTPATFVDQLRLNEARRRLLVPRYTVRAVSESVGFKNCDTFRRAFERRFGVSPSNYRNRFLFRARHGATQPGIERPSIVSARRFSLN